MDKGDDTAKHKEAIEKDLVNYSKLDAINNSKEFDTFFDLQIDTVAQKMLSLFTGTGPQNWDEFCRVRGEVVAMLYPIQQIRGAKVMKDQLKEQLSDYYNQKV